MTAETSSNVLRQLRDVGVGALLAILIATCGFVAARNTELLENQRAIASRAADAVASGGTAPADVPTVIVGPAHASPRHPYLKHRAMYQNGAWRPLGGSPALEAADAIDPSNDKLFYDAAMRFDRSGLFTVILRDGSARAIAARWTLKGVAIAVAPPARPAPYPFLVVIGVLGLGIALAGAGALVGGRAARAGAFAGVATLAIPCVLWRSPVAATAIVLLGAALALAQGAQLTDRIARSVRRNRTALTFLAPAAIAMLVLVIAPYSPVNMPFQISAVM